MKKLTTLLAIGTAAIGIQSASYGAIILDSVNWTGSGIPASGVIFDTNNITLTSANTGNAGALFDFDWGTMPFASGYNTSTTSSVAIGYTAGVSITTITFSAAISNLSLWFNFIDPATTFDFSGLNWTFVGGNNASRVGNTVVSTGNNNPTDGFLVNVAGSFGADSPLSFSIDRFSSDTAGFTLSAAAPTNAVPEPGTWAAAALLAGGAALSRWRRRQKA